jgi:carboxylesterase type B
VNLLDGSSKTINSFLGVPFGKSPTGDLRFELPQKPDPWSDVFVASRLRAACSQDVLGVLWVTHPGWVRISENCLNLNIYTPERTDIPHAVMVWFFGGGYVSGANIQYPGHFLATKDVVVVVPNYRVAIFGFLSTPGGLVKGNMGLYDQTLALEFVRDNIAAFGGLPNRVTIFGQSAGAGSTALHMISPKSRGLYYQAIQESGTEQNFWALNFPPQEPETYVYQVADQANCPKDDEAAMIACLKGLTARQLRNVQNITCHDGYFCQGFAPVVDGPGGFVPDSPIKLRNELKENSVPLMSGICKDDGSLYTIFLIPESNQGDGFNSTEYEYYFKERLISIFAGQLTQQQYNDAYEATMFYYRPWPYIDDHPANREEYNKMITDAAFGTPWDRQGKVNSEYKDTFMYVQAFRSLNGTSFLPEWMGVPHMGELPYVWCYGCLLINPEVREDSEMTIDIVGWTTEDILYGEYVMTLWTNFAKFGDPTPNPGVKAPFNDTLTKWERFRMDDNLKVFYLDAEISTKTVYHQQRYAFFREYMSYIIDRPLMKKNKSGKIEGMNSQIFKEAFAEYIADALMKAGAIDDNVLEMIEEEDF